MQNKTTIIASLILATGLAVAGGLISTTLYKARMADNKVTVKGLAEREVKSNLAIWSLSYTVTGADLQQVQKQAAQNRDVIIDFLKREGFQSSDILVSGANVRDLMSDAYNQSRISASARYVVDGSVTVRTQDVHRVDQTVGKTGDIVNQGVVLTNTSNPVYKFTALNEVKPEMLRDATQNAREAAQQFANDSETNVKGIANAQQGYFTIDGADGFEYQGDASLFKKVRVVTTVTFYLGE